MEDLNRFRKLSRIKVILSISLFLVLLVGLTLSLYLIQTQESFDLRRRAMEPAAITSKGEYLDFKFETEGEAGCINPCFNAKEIALLKKWTQDGVKKLMNDIAGKPYKPRLISVYLQSRFDPEDPSRTTTGCGLSSGNDINIHCQLDRPTTFFHEWYHAQTFKEGSVYPPHDNRFSDGHAELAAFELARQYCDNPQLSTGDPTCNVSTYHEAAAANLAGLYQQNINTQYTSFYQPRKDDWAGYPSYVLSYLFWQKVYSANENFLRDYNLWTYQLDRKGARSLTVDQAFAQIGKASFPNGIFGQSFTDWVKQWYIMNNAPLRMRNIGLALVTSPTYSMKDGIYQLFVWIHHSSDINENLINRYKKDAKYTVKVYDRTNKLIGSATYAYRFDWKRHKFIDLSLPRNYTGGPVQVLVELDSQWLAWFKQTFPKHQYSSISTSSIVYNGTDRSDQQTIILRTYSAPNTFHLTIFDSKNQETIFNNDVTGEVISVSIPSYKNRLLSLELRDLKTNKVFKRDVVLSNNQKIEKTVYLEMSRIIKQ